MKTIPLGLVLRPHDATANALGDFFCPPNTNASLAP